MPKKCYVIMPYGGNDPERRERFEGVFRSIICPAATAAGYEAIREDHEATPGNITRNIILNLAGADMVVADLTGGNANVFYELGIRHVLTKSRTVLICHQDYQIPFDTAAYQVILYSDDVFSSHQVHKKMVEAFQLREQSPSVPDNSVHDYFPDLPVSIQELLTQDEDDQKRQIQNLTVENARLKERLKAVGLTDPGTHLNVKELFARARKDIPFSGKSAIVRLRELQEQNRTDQFVDFLEEVVMAGYLSESEYVAVSQICEAMDLPTIRQALLEIALERFPKNQRIRTLLINQYASGYATRDKALALIHEEAGIIRDEDGRYQLQPDAARKITDRILSTLYNTYIQNDMYEEILDISRQLQEGGCPRLSMIYRNTANACINLDRLEEAREWFQKLMEVDYNEASNHIAFSRYFDAVNDPARSYEEVEIAICLDAEEPDRYFTLAGQMFDDRYVRQKDGSIRKVGLDAVIQAAIPFVFQTIVLSQDRHTLNRAYDFLRRNGCSSYIKVLEQQVNNGSFPDFSPFNAYPLEYAIRREPQREQALLTE